MNCDGYQELVSALMDNQLQETESASIFRHLGECDRCRSFMRTLLHLRSALATSKELTVPGTMDGKVLSIPLHSSAARRLRFLELWREKFVVPVPALAAAGLLFLVLLATSRLFHPDNEAHSGEQKVVYVIGMQPIEVMETHNQTHHDIQ